MKVVSVCVIALSGIVLLGCVGEKPEEQDRARDIVHEEFPEAREAVRGAIHRLNDIVARGDWEALRSAHPKFSDVGGSMHRSDFDEMIEAEIAACKGMNRPHVDWRNLRIDVFGDVAVATAFPLFSGTDEGGEPVSFDAIVTFVHVKTPEGWKIAHEHVSQIVE